MFYGLKTQNSDTIETPIGKYDIDEHSVIGPNGGMSKHKSCKHFDMEQESEDILCVALILTE